MQLGLIVKNAILTTTWLGMILDAGRNVQHMLSHSGRWMMKVLECVEHSVDLDFI